LHPVAVRFLLNPRAALRKPGIGPPAPARAPGERVRGAAAGRHLLTSPKADRGDQAPSVLGAFGVLEAGRWGEPPTYRVASRSSSRHPVHERSAVS
jgi:hypothetical protein